VYAALERGVIDATEWSSPSVNEPVGFHKIAKYIIFPGIHQPGATQECEFNKEAWDKISKKDQQLIKYAGELRTFRAWRNHAYNDLSAYRRMEKGGNTMLRLEQSFIDTPSRDYIELWKKDAVDKDGYLKYETFGEEDEEKPVRGAGAMSFFPRDDIRHAALIVRLSDLLAARNRRESTGSLFVGDTMAGISPLIRGYRLIKKLGVTTHSAVYLAERDTNKTKVVLKVLRHIPEIADSVGAFDRFLQEYELIADLDHPNIVRIYDLGVSDDHAHIVMEYLDGGDLKQRIKSGVSEPVAVEYIRQIASARPDNMVSPISPAAYMPRPRVPISAFNSASKF